MVRCLVKTIRGALASTVLSRCWRRCSQALTYTPATADPHAGIHAIAEHPIPQSRSPALQPPPTAAATCRASNNHHAASQAANHVPNPAAAPCLFEDILSLGPHRSEPSHPGITPIIPIENLYKPYHQSYTNPSSSALVYLPGPPRWPPPRILTAYGRARTPLRADHRSRRVTECAPYRRTHRRCLTGRDRWHTI